MMERKELIQEINKLKKDKNAIILVHNYQRSEIYEVADFIGDSFELSKKAAETNADIIVFCGVDFMAETAKILNPKKTVLLPEKSASCPMSRMITKKELGEMKKKYPNAAVVSYVNTKAETKAESDVCVTSANAVKIVNLLKQKEIIFVPDRNLGSYVQSKTDKKIITNAGFCCVHQKIDPEDVKKIRELKKSIKVLVHPECRKEVVDLADAVCSTSQMISYAKESDANEFLIVTEEGMVNRLRRDIPTKTFYALGGICVQMKKITLESVLNSLKLNKYKVTLDKKTEEGARKALTKMLEMGK